MQSGRTNKRTSFRTLESLESRLLLTGADCAPTITQTGSAIIAVGTAMADDVQLTMGQNTHTLDFNGFRYTYNAGQINEIRIGGAGGEDSIRVVGSQLNDFGRAMGFNGSLVSNQYSAFTFSFENTTIVGGGGQDTASLFGSTGNDDLTSFAESTVLTTPTVTLEAEGFERVDSYGRGGYDTGRLFGSQANDTLVGLDEYVAMFGAGVARSARGFDRVDGFGRGGYDFARLFDSNTNDAFVSTPEYGYIRTPNRLNSARGFEEVEAIANGGGFDRTVFQDGANQAEVFTLTQSTATIQGVNYTRSAQNFDNHAATSTGGEDTARILELNANETVQNNGIEVLVNSPTRSARMVGFPQVEFDGLSGLSEFDTFLASLTPYFSQGTIDQLAARIAGNRTQMNGTNGGEQVIGTGGGDEINSNGGNDVIFSVGGNDLVRAGAGNDSVDTNNGNDVAFGGNGNDELKGGNGNDILLGGAGNDIVDGEGGTDFVSGGTGNDIFRFISLDQLIYITDFDPSRDRIELINIDPADIWFTTQNGSLSIRHPDGMNIVLLGVSPQLRPGGFDLAYVTSQTQTLFTP